MARGGCLTCMHGGSSLMNTLKTLLKLITTIGVFLILIGVMYHKDIFQTQAIRQETYSYFSIFLGILLIFISAITWIRTQ